LIVSAIRWVFRDRSDVFVAANFAWFVASNDSRDPDVLVAFGRPNTPRSSWHNDREEGVSPSVIFEMKSRSNTRAQIAAKRAWYEKNGVAEYYEYDPELGTFRAWVRNESGHLEAVLRSPGMTSPLLNLTFVLNATSLELLGPDGRILGDYVSAESAAEVERERAELERERAELENARAESESARAETESSRANAERERANIERDRANAAIAELDALRTAIAEGR
jgi:Putative restriction endonuclease